MVRRLSIILHYGRTNRSSGHSQYYYYLYVGKSNAWTARNDRSQSVTLCNGLYQSQRTNQRGVVSVFVRLVLTIRAW